MYYLFNKVTTEYTGTEAEIRRKMENKDYNWVPYMATEVIRVNDDFDLDLCLKEVKGKIQRIGEKNKI